MLATVADTRRFPCEVEMGPCARTCVYMGEATHMRGSSQNLLQEVCQHLTPSALVASFGFSGLRVGSRARTRKFAR